MVEKQLTVGLDWIGYRPFGTEEGFNNVYAKPFSYGLLKIEIDNNKLIIEQIIKVKTGEVKVSDRSTLENWREQSITEIQYWVKDFETHKYQSYQGLTEGDFGFTNGIEQLLLMHL